MTLLAPLLFRDGRPVESLGLAAAADPESTLAAHAGHFAIHEEDGGEHWLARDLLGVHKLFFAVDGDGRLETSTFLVELLRAGHAFERIFSVPSGHRVRCVPAERRYELRRWGRLRYGWGAARHGALADFAATIRAALERTFALLARHFAGRPVYVTLSGGLDSTTIAALAREHFPDVRAITFALCDPRESAPGADLYFARRAARELGIPHLDVLAEPDEVLALLDDVLVYGQDYRDFNVHCGLMNAVIARSIGAQHASGPRPVVLTGDTMNELMADYTPVQFRGRMYYGLPPLSRGRLRRFLVAGLDSGDREVGLFARFGVDAVQPFALCAREYASLPEELAAGAASKAALARAVLGSRIPDYVYARPKVRAQVAVEGEPGGTLALLAGRGIDQEELRRRFAELLGIDVAALCGFLRAGFYRCTTCYPSGAFSRAPTLARCVPETTAAIRGISRSHPSRGAPMKGPRQR